MLTPTQLREKLEKQFPRNATCWSQATDEVRDMSRVSREIRDVPERFAVDFIVITTPAEWNSKGIDSIVNNYEKMTTVQRTEFIAFFGEWLKPFKPQPTERSHLIQMTDRQLALLVKVLNHANVPTDLPVEDAMEIVNIINMSDDLVKLPDSQYDRDTINGFCL